MSKFFYIPLLFLLLTTLSACTSTTPERNISDSKSFQGLSADQHLGEELGELSEQKGSIEQAPPPSLLPFQDFKERWNAVTDEYLTNLYIHELNKVPSDNGTSYTSTINDKIKLYVYVTGDTINQLELITKCKTKSDVFPMLESWNQLIKVLYPNIEIHDVDTLFHDLGIGPNADLSRIKEKKVSYFGIDYEIIPTQEGYIFKASFTP